MMAGKSLWQISVQAGKGQVRRERTANPLLVGGGKREVCKVRARVWIARVIFLAWVFCRKQALGLGAAFPPHVSTL
jgi:hypothetical protein